MATPKKIVTFNQWDIVMKPPTSKREKLSESFQASLTFQHPSPLLILPNTAQITWFLPDRNDKEILSPHTLPTVVPQPTMSLAHSYFKHVADLFKPGSKVTPGFLLKQGKGGISRWDLVGWINLWKGLSLLMASAAKLPEGNSAACLKPGGMSRT